MKSFFAIITFTIIILFTGCSGGVSTPKVTNKPAANLNVNDFSISDGKNTITLDFPYKDFKINKQEIKNNYVGEVYSGDFVYKTWEHDFLDFSIYVTNTNYNIKKRNFDQYFISQISLKNSVFKTKRGITIGSDITNVQNLYGEGLKTVEGDNLTLAYQLSDMKLSFKLNKKQKVIDITMIVVAKAYTK